MINITESINYSELAKKFYNDASKYFGDSDIFEASFELNHNTVSFKGPSGEWSVTFDYPIKFYALDYDIGEEGEYEEFYADYDEFIDAFNDLYAVDLPKQNNDIGSEQFDNLVFTIQRAIENIDVSELSYDDMLSAAEKAIESI